MEQRSLAPVVVAFALSAPGIARPVARSGIPQRQACQRGPGHPRRQSRAAPQRRRRGRVRLELPDADEQESAANADQLAARRVCPPSRHARAVPQHHQPEAGRGAVVRLARERHVPRDGLAHVHGVFGPQIIRDQRNVSGNPRLQMNIAPGRPFGATVMAGYTRVVLPNTTGNPDTSFTQNRPEAGLDLVLNPGAGTLEFRAGYQIVGDALRDARLGPELQLGAHTGALRGRWRFNPRNSIFSEATLGRNMYTARRSARRSPTRRPSRPGSGSTGSSRRTSAARSASAGRRRTSTRPTTPPRRTSTPSRRTRASRTI